MKKAIEILREQGVTVTDEGVITSELPDGIDGILLNDILEDGTVEENGLYSIIGDRIQFIEC